VWEFVNGPLAAEPYRVGKALRYELEGYLSARRGQYRVVYRVVDNTVQILRVDHRRTVYHDSATLPPVEPIGS